MHRLGRRLAHTPRKKTLENRYKVEMHVHSPTCQCQVIEKKIIPLTLIVWVQGRVEKNGKKKSQKNEKKIFFNQI